MRVFGRGLILAGLICVLAPASAQASPLIVGLPDDPASCAGIVSATTLSCSLFSLGVLTGSSTFDVEFGSNADVALFEFSIAADSDFLALTSSLGLDTMLGLFRDTGVVYQYDNSVEGDFTDAFGVNITDSNLNDQLGGFALTAGTSYYLAVLLDIDPWTNGFSGDPESLSRGFACDGECLGSGGSFSLTLSAMSDEQPVPVPEPGTLTLMGSGVLAALVRRRRKSVHRQ